MTPSPRPSQMVHIGLCRGIGLPGCPACARMDSRAVGVKAKVGETSCGWFVDRVKVAA